VKNLPRIEKFLPLFILGLLIAQGAFANPPTCDSEPAPGGYEENPEGYVEKTESRVLPGKNGVQTTSVQTTRVRCVACPTEKVPHPKWTRVMHLKEDMTSTLITEHNPLAEVLNHRTQIDTFDACGVMESHREVVMALDRSPITQVKGCDGKTVDRGVATITSRASYRVREPNEGTLVMKAEVPLAQVKYAYFPDSESSDPSSSRRMIGVAYTGKMMTGRDGKGIPAYQSAQFGFTKEGESECASRCLVGPNASGPKAQISDEIARFSKIAGHLGSEPYLFDLPTGYSEVEFLDFISDCGYQPSSASLE